MKHVKRPQSQQILPINPDADITSSADVSEADSATHSASDASVGKYAGSSLKVKVPARESIDYDATRAKRKRKRSNLDDDLEGRYLDQLALEDSRDFVRSQTKGNDKRQKHERVEHSRESGEPNSDSDSEVDESDISSTNESGSAPDDVPQHETVSASKDELELEKASRTVFLANVSTLAIKSKSAKKALLDHLSSLGPPHTEEKDVRHKVESLRFRSTAFANSGAPRKAAYAKKELMDATTKSTNAYAVYNSQAIAREATTNLNGTMVLDRHLRVDSVAHPAKMDHRRCVFVGNLGFVDDDTNINAAEDGENGKRPRKAKEPSDIEEGLWRQFGKAGTVESVRVVRDKTTRVGKGFAYVQFKDGNAVEKALLYNEKKFPPMLPRILRVTRAKNLRKVPGHTDKKIFTKRTADSKTTYKPKISSQEQSLAGRAGKLLGRAGATQLKAKGDMKHQSTPNINAGPQTATSTIFEGYRASQLQGKGVLKSGGSGKTPGKPRNRSSRRGAEFKAKGKKKART